MSSLAWATIAICVCIIIGANAIVTAVQKVGGHRGSTRLDQDQLDRLINAINRTTNEVFSLHAWLSREEHEGAFDKMIESWRAKLGDEEGEEN